MSYLTDSQLNFNRGIDASIKKIKEKIQVGTRAVNNSDNTNSRILLLRTIIEELECEKYL